MVLGARTPPQVLAEPPVRSDSWRGHALAVLVAALVTGGAWAAVVPSFEGPDEVFFYREARRFAVRPERQENLFDRIAAPIVRAMPTPAEPVEPRSNPAFQHIGLRGGDGLIRANVHGEVNRWNHDRPSVGREHTRVLGALRALVVLIAATTAVMIFAMARLVLASRTLPWIVLGLGLWIPQASFMNAVVQREVVTEWLGAAVALVVAARVIGRLNRWSTWALLLGLIALVPIADRQAYFLVPFAVVSLIFTERTWRQRALATVAIVAPAVAVVFLVTRGAEAGTDLTAWVGILRAPLRPFEAGNGDGVPGAAYYAYEFLPKLFMGFWGWMGQPSILLPAEVYGGLAVLSVVAAAGLLLRIVTASRTERSDDDRRRLRARRLLALGVVLMCGPIVYGPAIAGRNLWYGHWLFPMLGAIAVGFVLGIAEMVRVARLHPHRLAIGLLALTAVAAALWLSGPGETMRVGITVNHYGDSARVIESIREAIVGLGITALIVEAAALLRRWNLAGPAWPATPVIVGGMAALNMCLLVAFVRPLYAPVTPPQYVALIARYSDARDFARAADIYASAIKSYPDSTELIALGDAAPRLLTGGKLEEMVGLIERRLALGAGLRDRDALLALAARLRESHWTGTDALRAALADAERDPELREVVALVRLELGHHALDGAEAVAPIEAGNGRRLMVRLRNEMLLEGYTAHDLPDVTQVILYLRPATTAESRRIWLHAYPIGYGGTYMPIEPTIAPAAWRPGDLVWEVFELPKGRFGVYVGLWVGNDIGTGTGIGEVPLAP